MPLRNRAETEGESDSNTAFRRPEAGKTLSEFRRMKTRSTSRGSLSLVSATGFGIRCNGIAAPRRRARLDRAGRRQIGNRATHAQDPVIATRAEAEPPDGGVQQLRRLRAQSAVRAEHARPPSRHSPTSSPNRRLLSVARGDHPRANRARWAPPVDPPRRRDTAAGTSTTRSIRSRSGPDTRPA